MDNINLDYIFHTYVHMTGCNLFLQTLPSSSNVWRAEAEVK